MDGTTTATFSASATLRIYGPLAGTTTLTASASSATRGVGQMRGQILPGTVETIVNEVWAKVQTNGKTAQQNLLAARSAAEIAMALS